MCVKLYDRPRRKYVSQWQRDCYVYHKGPEYKILGRQVEATKSSNPSAKK